MRSHVEGHDSKPVCDERLYEGTELCASTLPAVDEHDQRSSAKAPGLLSADQLEGVALFEQLLFAFRSRPVSGLRKPMYAKPCGEGWIELGDVTQPGFRFRAVLGCPGFRSNVRANFFHDQFRSVDVAWRLKRERRESAARTRRALATPTSGL